MKIILLQDVENVGKKFEVKEVKAGYARNFLIPQNLGKVANKQNLQWLAENKEAIEKQIEEGLKEAQGVASKMDGEEVAIAVKVGPEGQLFESVNSAKIAEKLKEMGFEIKKAQVKLAEPIKTVGEFPVKVSLDHNLEVEVTVIVSGETEGEADPEKI